MKRIFNQITIQLLCESGQRNNMDEQTEVDYEAYLKLPVVERLALLRQTILEKYDNLSDDEVFDSLLSRAVLFSDFLIKKGFSIEFEEYCSEEMIDESIQNFKNNLLE